MLSIIVPQLVRYRCFVMTLHKHREAEDTPFAIRYVQDVEVTSTFCVGIQQLELTHDIANSVKVQRGLEVSDWAEGLKHDLPVDWSWCPVWKTGIASYFPNPNHLLVPQHHQPFPKPHYMVLIPKWIKHQFKQSNIDLQHQALDERPKPSCLIPRVKPDSVCPFQFKFGVSFFSESKGLPCQLRSPKHVCVWIKSKRHMTKCLHVTSYTPDNFLFLVTFAVASGSIQLTKDYSNFFPLMTMTMILMSHLGVLLILLLAKV